MAGRRAALGPGRGPAFLFVWRSQFTITVQPVAFLLLSAVLFWKATGPGARARALSLVISGVAASLAVYGYFHFAFWALAIAAFVLATRRRSVIVPWLIGGLVGITPIVVGLARLVMAQGSTDAIAIEMAIKQPTAPGPTGLERLGVVWSLFEQAWTGQGIATSVFVDRLPFVVDVLRPVVLLGIPIAVWLASELRRRPDRVLRFLLPLTIVPGVLLGLAFGERLGPWHLAIVVPLAYGTAAVAWSRLADGMAGNRWRAAGAAIAISLVLAVNIVNAKVFTDRLAATGGARWFSDAITGFDHAAAGDQAVYLFPDWGLWTSFAMTNRGQVPIVLSFSPDLVRQIACGGRDVVLASMEVTLQGSDNSAAIAERIASVPLPAPVTTVYSERDGTPLIAATRWTAREGCVAARQSAPRTSPGGSR